MGLRLPHQYFDGFIVKDIAAIVDQTILTVAGVWVKGNVGHHAQFGKILFYCCNHARHEAVRIIGFTRIKALQRRVYHRKDRQHRDSQLYTLLSIF